MTRDVNRLLKMAWVEASQKKEWETADIIEDAIRKIQAK